MMRRVIALLCLMIAPALGGCATSSPIAPARAADGGRPSPTAAGAWTEPGESGVSMILNADGTGDISTGSVTNFGFDWQQSGHTLRLSDGGQRIGTANLSDDAQVANIDTTGPDQKYSFFPDTMVRRH